MRGLSSILSIFDNEFNKFNNTGAWMLDSITGLKNHIFGVKKGKISFKQH